MATVTKKQTDWIESQFLTVLEMVADGDISPITASGYIKQIVANQKDDAYVKKLFWFNLGFSLGVFSISAIYIAIEIF